ncbi:MAG: asparaginase domain-containing protein [Bacteroidales bacterium]
MEWFANPKTGTLVPFNFRSHTATGPELKRFECRLDTIAFTPLIDSSEVTIETWIRLPIIEENYSSYDGFVILHGTDTMAYTASALSFLLCNLDKPVILTGSQLPIGMPGPTGKKTLSPQSRLPLPVYTGNQRYLKFQSILRTGCSGEPEPTKLSSEHFNAFDSP